MTCPRCNVENAMGSEDEHGICFVSSGMSHQRSACKFCQGMPRHRKLERAWMQTLWREDGTDNPPPVRTVRELVASKGRWDLLRPSAVERFISGLGPQRSQRHQSSAAFQ